MSASATTHSTTGAFITTWETTSPNESITIPVGGFSGSYTVNWGDDSTDANVSGDRVHLYSTLGNHTVIISGNFSKIYLGGDQNNAAKLRSIDQWGSAQWTSMEGAFKGASNMVYRAIDSPDLLRVTNTASMFHDAVIFNGDLSGWDVSHVTDMSDMFKNADSFNGDLSGWDVSHVTDMSDMFLSADSFAGDLSDWDVSSVTDMSRMFWFATNFNSDLSGWDVQSAENMSGMFDFAFAFNSDLSGWDVSRVTDMSRMFEHAFAFNSDLSGWDVSRVTNMRSMFSGVANFNSDLSGWDVSRVTNMRSMFSGANSFNSDISNWNITSVTDIKSIFSWNSAFAQNLGKWYIVLDDTTLDIDDVPMRTYIFPQTEALTDELPSYKMGSGDDSGSFHILARNQLWMTLPPDRDLYTVTITYDGSPGTNNHRVYNITVTNVDPDSATAPIVTSITRSSPSDATTSKQTLVFKVMFSENVIGVDANDFVLSSESTGAGSMTSLKGSGSVYYVTVSATQSGTYNLDLVSSGHGITDTANNLLTDTVPTAFFGTAADDTYTVNIAATDSTDPTLTSIQRSNPAVANTDSQTLIYEVTFSEDVTGVDASDFALSSSSTGGPSNGNSLVTAISNSDNVYYVTVFASTDGTYNLDLISSGHGIEDTAENPLTNTVPTTGTDHTYTVNTVPADSTAPTISSIQRYNPAVANTDSQTLIYEVAFSEDVTGVDASDFALSSGSTGGPGNGTSPVTGVSGSGDVYHVTVSALQDGTYNLNLILWGHGIEDIADNLLADTVPTTGTDHTYTVSTTVADSTAPTLTSIERSNPAAQNTNSQTLVYKATFSEDVTGIDTDDFVLSSDSTGGVGGINTGNSSERFTQTRSPALAIPGVVTVSDIITVPDSGTATSVSVSVDIAHTWIGDLLVELIAPDGTAITLHGRGGGSADDIDQTYAPDFEGVLIAGNWTLRIDDNFVDDPGVLNSWTLTVDYGNATTTTTTTTATGISGSGDVYYVTVSAMQDGTYNLDLVSSGHGIKDAAENPLADTAPTTGTDHTYTVSTTVADSTAPTISSIQRYNPAVANTDSQTLIYEVTFSEDVTGVDASDFALSSGSTGGPGNGTSPVTGVSGSGDVYHVTVSALQDGTYNLNLILWGHGIEDIADNLLADTVPTTGTDHTYTVSTTVADSTAPTLTSIERSNPAAQNTNSQTLVYKATFSEDVTGIDTNDFVLSSDSTGGVGGINTGNSSERFTQTRSPALAIPGVVTVSDIITVPDSGTATSVSVSVDIAHTWIGDLLVELIAPDGTTVITLHNRTGTDADNIVQTYEPDFGGVSITGNWTLRIDDNFVDDPGVLNSWTLTVDYGNAATATATPITATDISGSGDVYYVTVSASTDGTYNLDLVSSGHGIKDAAENPLADTAPTTGTDHTYTVSTTVADSTAPTLTSIERSNPTTQNTTSQTLFTRQPSAKT